MPTNLKFKNVTITPITRENQMWLTAPQIAKALGYKKPDAIAQIYSRNADEFSIDMTMTLDLKPADTETLDLSVSVTNNNLLNQTRVFSLRGAHLVAMLSRTPLAKEFRKWVLDILDTNTDAPNFGPKSKRFLDRYMVSFDTNGNEVFSFIPRDAYVLSPSRFFEMMSDGSTPELSNDQLSNFIISATKILNNRLDCAYREISSFC